MQNLIENQAVLERLTNEHREKIDTQTLATFHYLKGRQDFFTDKFDEAIEEFSQALKLNTNYAQAYYDMGLCFIRKDKYLQAKILFDCGIAIDKSILDKSKDLKDMLKLLNKYAKKYGGDAK